jgi:DNA-binding Lrp family transcriptional regulator
VSWQASAWAKKTRGLRSIGDKLLLMILAEYAHPETGECWPSQQSLADDSGMTPRNVIRCLNSLQESGFITRSQKGNQHRPSLYMLHMSHTQPSALPTPAEDAHIGEGDISASDIMSHTGEGDIIDKVKVTYETSEGDIHVGTNLQEPLIEPSISPQREPWPDWYSTLWAIPGFKTPLDHAKEWLMLKNISENHAESTAYALKGRWDGKKYKDAWATFQNWAKRPPLGVSNTNSNGHRPGAKTAPTLERMKEIKRMREVK